jgi:hypothetical protein
MPVTLLLTPVRQQALPASIDVIETCTLSVQSLSQADCLTSSSVMVPAQLGQMQWVNSAEL